MLAAVEATHEAVKRGLVVTRRAVSAIGKP